MQQAAYSRCVRCRFGAFRPVTHVVRMRRNHRVRSILEEVKGEQRGSTSFDIIYTSKQLPKVALGPIQLTPIAGRGRGVVVNRDVRPGELLFVSAPVGIVRREMGDIPEPEELRQLLKSKLLTPTQLKQLESLYAGGDAPLAPTLPGFGEDFSEATPTAVTQLPDPTLEAVIAFNVFGEQSEDLPAGLSRGDVLSGHLGIWPEFSMLNHSCLPNANSYVIGDRMVVRAARPIAASDEVTINYLGRASLTPLAIRNQDLKDGYGFTCNCPRCQLEERTQPEVSGALSRVYAWLQQEILPQLNEAFAAGDKTKISSLRGQLSEMLESIEEELTEMDLAPDVQARLLAGAFDLYSTYNNVLAEDGQYDEQVGQCTTALAGRIAPGSDLHILLAVQLLNKVLENHGLESQQALIVGNEVQLAVALRYGPDVKPETQQLLIKNATQALEIIAL